MMKVDLNCVDDGESWVLNVELPNGKLLSLARVHKALIEQASEVALIEMRGEPKQACQTFIGVKVNFGFSDEEQK